MSRFDRPSGLTSEEYNYNQCCYSCMNVGRIDHNKCKCRLSCYGDTKINRDVYDKNTCDYYEQDKLVICKECNRYFKKVTQHLKSHGITPTEYKDKHGYNRTTSLCSKAYLEENSMIALKKDLGSYGVPNDGRTNRGNSYKLSKEGYKNRNRYLRKKKLKVNA